MMKRKILPIFVTYCLLFTAFFALSVNNVAAQSKKDLKEAKELVKNGDTMFNRKQYAQAIDYYAKALTLVPNYPYAHYWKGYSHYNLKEFDTALSALNTAFEQQHPPLEVYKVRWFVNYQLKNFDDAFKDAAEGLKLDSENAMFKAGLADIYYARNDYANALKYYEQIVETVPNKSDVYFFIANSHFNLGNTQAQAEAGQKAVDNKTKFLGESYYLIGDAMQKSKNYDEAVKAFVKAKEIKPEIYGIYPTLGEIYRMKSQFKDAIAITKQGLLLYPKDAGLYVDLSWYQSLAGQPEEAIGSAERALVFDPNQAMAYTNMCRGYNSLKNYPRAKVICNQALELSPDDGETHLYLGFVYLGLKKNAEAKEHFAKAVDGLTKYTKENPEYSDGFYLLGSAYYSTGEVKKAIQAYERSLELSPRFARARYNLGIAYFVDQNQNLADEQYNALLDLDKQLAEDLKGIIKK